MHCPGYGRDVMVEPGLVTLFKIVGTLMLGQAIIPLLFLLAPGARAEPPVEECFDGDVVGHGH